METFQHRLTLQHIERARRKIDPVFLNSPQYICEPLGEALGCRILLKVETLNPIRSFKGRGADFLVSGLKEAQPVFCASAGNFGQAMAYACRKHHMPLTVYAAATANAYKLSRMKALGAEVVLFGDSFETAKEEGRRVAQKEGDRFVEDSVELETLAGAGTIGLELLQLPHQIDFLLIALGNGALVNGIAKAFKHHRPSTKIVAVQAKGAPAMMQSWQSGTLVSFEKASTIADGIAVRLPIPQALEDMKGLVDEGMLVEEKSMLEGMKLLHTHAGIVAEPSAAVGIAAILENPQKFQNSSIATVICGGNLTEEQMRQWL